MATWTVDDLIADMKRKCNLPAGSNTKLNDTQIARIAFEVVIKEVDPILLTLQEEYDVVREDFTITSGDGTYRLPERCISGTLVQALIVSADGRPQPLTRVGGSDAWQFEGTGSTSALPGCYVLEGDLVRLLPTPSVSGLTLRLRYRRRPSSFVLTTACGVVSVVGGTTLTAPGGTFGASPTVDVVRAKPPVGVLVQSAATTYLANVFTFGAGVLTDAGVSVGDYVCAYDTTCVVPVPERFYMLLSDLAGAQLASEWGYADRAVELREQADAYVTRLKTSQSNRVAAQPLLAIQRGGVLRGAFGRRRG